MGHMIRESRAVMGLVVIDFCLGSVEGHVIIERLVAHRMGESAMAHTLDGTTSSHNCKLYNAGPHALADTYPTSDSHVIVGSSRGTRGLLLAAFAEGLIQQQ